MIFIKLMIGLFTKRLPKSLHHTLNILFSLFLIIFVELVLKTN